MPWQFGISTAMALTAAALSWPPTGIPGHTYDATANCIYSMLRSATMVVRKRMEREVFMVLCYGMSCKRMWDQTCRQVMTGGPDDLSCISRAQVPILTCTLAQAGVVRHFFVMTASCFCPPRLEILASLSKHMSASLKQE